MTKEAVYSIMISMKLTCGDEMFDRYLKPDFVFNTFLEITPEFLLEKGIEGLICDIDNTLVSYDDATPTEDVLAWYEKLRAAQIKVSFVSNNKHGRVSKFNEELGLPAFAKSGKPNGRALRAAMEAMETGREETAVLGDQLFTDVLAAKRVGLCAMIVFPIKDKKTPFVKCKRFLERQLMRRYTI